MTEFTEDYEVTVRKLLDKTRTGKVPWKTTAEEDTFVAAIEGLYTFQVAKVQLRGGPRVSFGMRDREGQTIFEMNAWEPSSDTTTENDQKYNVLGELFERARRAALQIDKKVNEVNSFLDRL